MSPRVLFYILRNLHLPFLEPVQEQLLQLCPDIETAFFAPLFIAPQNGQPGWGLEENEVLRLQQKARFVRTVEEFSPDITVFADACTNIFNCGKRVFVGHGIISKGGFYTDNPLVRRENLADLICVPGPWHKRILEKNVFSPIVVTGFIKSDRLFGAKASTKEDFCKQYNIPVGAKIILYAPTFNEELSAIPCIGEQIACVCEPDRYLLIKLHTMTDTAIADSHRRLAQTHPRIRYIEDIDVTPAMVAADILVSDVSSVLVEFMALDRPVIAVNNPLQTKYPYYCPTDIEYKVRDACQQVDNAKQLLAAVDQAILNPGLLSDKRCHYADELCWLRDGQAAKRVAAAILDLADNRLEAPQITKHFALLVKTAPDYPLAQLLFDLGNLQLQHPDTKLDFVILGMPKPAVNLPMVSGWLLPDCDLSIALQVVTGISDAPYLAVIEAGCKLPERGLQALSNYFRWDEKTVMMRGLTTADPYRKLLQMVNPDWAELLLPEVVRLLSAALTGQEADMQNALPGCCMIRREQALNIAFAKSKISDLQQLRNQLSAKAGKCGLALDVMIIATTKVVDLQHQLAAIVEMYQQTVDNSYLLNVLLALLVHLGRYNDTRAIWQAAPAKATKPLQSIWGWLAA